MVPFLVGWILELRSILYHNKVCNTGERTEEDSGGGEPYIALVQPSVNRSKNAWANKHDHHKASHLREKYIISYWCAVLEVEKKNDK